MTEYVRVPLEPTPEMIEAGMLKLAGSIGGYEYGQVTACYAAMLAATPPPQDVEQIARELLAAEYERDGEHLDAEGCRKAWKPGHDAAALRAIVAALRTQAAEPLGACDCIASQVLHEKTCASLRREDGNGG